MKPDYPETVISKLLQIAIANSEFAYFAVDDKGSLLDQGGALEGLGLPRWTPSANVLEDVPFLDGSLPLAQPYECLPAVAIGDRVVDVHLFDEAGVNWVILIDQTPAQEWQGIARQKTNELALLQGRLAAGDPGTPDNGFERDFFTALNLMALRRQSDGSFELLKPVAASFKSVYPQAFSESPLLPQDHFPFLENFLVDAEALWQDPENTERVDSGPWVEVDDKGQEVPLHAFAKNWQASQLLFIGLLNEGYQQNYQFLQRGRESALLNAQLESEIQTRRAAEKALVEARNAAEQANRTKTDFLSNISHELRTSLNAIIGFGQLLSLSDTLTEQDREFVQEILSAGEHQLSLINDLLDLAKIERGQIKVALQPVKIHEVLLECRKVVESMLLTLDLSFHFSVEDNLHVSADRVRLKQIILNLLTNAIKYNRKDGLVTVNAGLVDGGESIRITVEDTGFGISEEQLAQMFQPFNRLGQSEGDIEGTGLGLTISRHLVELMHGKMEVESEVGCGSRFTIVLPVGASPS